MDKFIPYEKLSKKKKRELDLKKRKTWAVSPVTRRPENPRAYNRKKARKRDPDDFTDASFFYANEKPAPDRSAVGRVLYTFFTIP